MLWRVSSNRRKTGAPLYLNVYDLTPFNGYMYWFGLGIYHSAIEAFDVEYAFGAHDHPTSGVFEVEPHSCPGFSFRKSILLGTVNLGPKEFREFVEDVATEYSGDSYHLIVRNCNHFCNDVCMRLTGSPIPGWVNRMAKLGSMCNCMLPDCLQVNAIRHTPEYHVYDCEEKHFQGTYKQLAGVLTTVAPRKRNLSASSIFLQSFRGGLIPWDWSSNIFRERLRHL